MKKVLFVCVAVVASLLFTNHTNAQTKIGTFDEESVLGLMPDIDKVSAALQSYAKDSLQVDYEYSVLEFNRRDSIYRKDSATMPARAREQATKELNQLKYKLVNWQQFQQESVRAKQEELLVPYKQKIYASLEKIIREQKYTHVFRNDALLKSPIGDNLSIKVAQDLKLNLPKEVIDELKNQGVPVPAAAAPTKPAAKTK
ncbi:MAG: OmpH family outer membrane protein [Sediminibacterium sp.]|jgi:Skp family chaperone for outer membrane proteins|nr:MAG: OmpH family outer membrane protein [Sediminibacterium sp.]